MNNNDKIIDLNERRIDTGHVIMPNDMAKIILDVAKVADAEFDPMTSTHPTVNANIPDFVKQEMLKSNLQPAIPPTSAYTNLPEEVLSMNPKEASDEDLIKESDDKTQSYNEIFSNTQVEMEKLATIKAQVNANNKQLKNLSTVITNGSEVKEDELIVIFNRFKALNKTVENLSEAEVDSLLSTIPIDENSLSLKTSQDLLEFKRSYLNFIIMSEDGNRIYDEAQVEIAQLTATFNNEIDHLISSMDYAAELQALQTQIKEETDPEKKKILNNQYIAIYSSLDMSNLIDKLKNKGCKATLKECNREFDNAKEKAFKILNNDKKHSYMNPSKIYQTLLCAFPDANDVEGIKLITYLLYKRINKRKSPDDQTHIFVNYFILNVQKLVTEGFKKEDSLLYTTIKDFLVTYKEME